MHVVRHGTRFRYKGWAVPEQAAGKYRRWSMAVAVTALRRSVPGGKAEVTPTE
jgi:hypothetical protein